MTTLPVGAGTRFANPFLLVPGHDDRAIGLFRDWLPLQPDLLRLARQLLPGKSLSCDPRSGPAHKALWSEVAAGAWDRLIPPEPVMVFGSNLRGRHGRGGALHARRYYGAEEGVGEGPTGNAYALPTKGSRLELLPLDTVLDNLDRFLAHARANPTTTFQLTRVGCGLAGQGPEHEAAIRERALLAPENVLLPGIWEAARQPDLVRVIVAGGRTFRDFDMIERRLDWLLSRIIHQGRRIEIVSGGAKGADTGGERYAIVRGLPLRRFPALWERYNKSAGGVRNQLMAWYSTNLVAFWDGSSQGTRSMIRLADSVNLRSRIVRLTPAS